MKQYVGQQGTYYNYYKTTDTKKQRGALELLDDLEMRLEAERRPDGSRAFPAKTCGDIQMCFPDSKSGNKIKDMLSRHYYLFVGAQFVFVFLEIIRSHHYIVAIR